MNADEILKITELALDSLGSKIKELQLKNSNLEAKIKQYSLSIYNIGQQPHLTVNELIVLLSIFRGTSLDTTIGTHQQDLKHLMDLGYIVPTTKGDDYIITHAGDTRVRLCKGELK